ncbi:MAG: LPS export ABC transporter periplasmic protein LptC [Bacteroidia bacterium]
MQNRTLVFLAVMLLLLGACANDTATVNAINKHNKEALNRVINAEIIYSDSGHVKAKITAPIIEDYDGDKPYTEFKKGIIAIMYDDDLKETTRMSARYAIKPNKKNYVEARNNVIVINEKGDQLNTEHIIWDEQQDRITSDAFVKIRTKDQIIFGHGLESNQSFSKYHILRPTGFINLNMDNTDSTNTN